jgi:hypothetical protein
VKPYASTIIKLILRKAQQGDGFCLKILLLEMAIKLSLNILKERKIAYQTCFSINYFARMKRGLTCNGVETFTFGIENKLRIFPPNSYKFKLKDHIVLDDVQE